MAPNASEETARKSPSRTPIALLVASSFLWVSDCTGTLGAPGVSDGNAGGPAAVPTTVACPEFLAGDPWLDRLGAHTLAERGALLYCAHVAEYSREDVARSPFFPPTIGPATNGLSLFIIQYVSEGQRGVARAVTALLSLPSGGLRNLAIVAVGHAFQGMGPWCGPTHAPIVSDPLAIPLVGRGYAVVAPDFAGVGVDNGMTSFLVGASEAAAMLDGVRALRKLRDPRFDAAQLGSDLFVVGHSQGGHAALFTHQFYGNELGVELRGSVALAPGLGSARDWARSLQDPLRPVRSMEIFGAMTLYARAGYDGAPEPNTWLSARAQAELPAMLHDHCSLDLFATIRSTFRTVGDLYQPSFVEAAAGCSFAGPCPRFEPWASTLVAEEPGRISSTVPSLVIEGLADVLVPPATVACVVDRMRTRGTPVQACGYAGEGHATIVTSAAPAVMRWIAARRLGATPDVCPAPLAIACDAP